MGENTCSCNQTVGASDITECLGCLFIAWIEEQAAKMPVKYCNSLIAANIVSTTAARGLQCKVWQRREKTRSCEMWEIKVTRANETISTANYEKTNKTGGEPEPVWIWDMHIVIQLLWSTCLCVYFIILWLRATCWTWLHPAHPTPCPTRSAEEMHFYCPQGKASILLICHIVLYQFRYPVI